MSNFTIGCDPEFFLMDALGSYISAIDRMGGTKEIPKDIPALGAGFNVQEDNVAVEFGVPPAASLGEWMHNVVSVREYLRQQIEEMGFQISTKSAVSFPKHELTDPRALEFGCEPDFNAWTGLKNPRPKAADKTLRSAGGHIHIGAKCKDKEDARLLIRYMDLCSIASVYMDDGLERKQLYGMPGAHRIKPYGVEYRALSNFWIFNEADIKWAFDVTERAVDVWQQKKIPINDMQDDIIGTLSTNDAAMAKKLVKTFNLPTR